MRNGKIKIASGGELDVSRVVLGAGSYGIRVKRDDAFKMMDRYVEAGGNIFDTGRMYIAWVKGGASQSEKTVGDWINARGVRDKVKILTKGAHPEWRSMHISRLAPECLEMDIRTSLAVMRTDYFDVWTLHRDDEKIPVGEIMDPLHDFVQEGICKVICASNWTIKRIKEANEYALKNGKTPFTASSIQWTLAGLRRNEMRDQTCVVMEPQEYEGYVGADLPIVSYTSQANGFFTKYLAKGEEAFATRQSVFLNEVNRKRAKKVEEVCKKLGVSPSALAVAYVTNDTKVSGFAVVGCSSMEQLNDSLGAADLTLDEETRQYLVS
jgi:aryl-alcohol dehydrogenase-like predicted oxidoreductase